MYELVFEVANAGYFLQKYPKAVKLNSGCYLLECLAIDLDEAWLNGEIIASRVKESGAVLVEAAEK